MQSRHFNNSHSAAWYADGLAVGAAVHGGNAQISAAVALAMIMHKAPAALGLTTFLIAARRVNLLHTCWSCLGPHHELPLCFEAAFLLES